jgi:hypothetical protein
MLPNSVTSLRQEHRLACRRGGQPGAALRIIGFARQPCGAFQAGARLLELRATGIQDRCRRRSPPSLVVCNIGDAEVQGTEGCWWAVITMPCRASRSPCPISGGHRWALFTVSPTPAVTWRAPAAIASAGSSSGSVAISLLWARCVGSLVVFPVGGGFERGGKGRRWRDTCAGQSSGRTALVPESWSGDVVSAWSALHRSVAERSASCEGMTPKGFSLVRKVLHLPQGC